MHQDYSKGNRQPWHTLPVAEVIAQLGTTVERGLTLAEAKERLATYGSNELQHGKRISPIKLLLEQCANVLVIMLLFAAVLSGFLGHEVEAISIAVIIVLAVLLGFVQEYRAEQAIEALRDMAAPTATVRRGGDELTIPAKDLVPGDIIILSAGDRIPADARIIESVSLHINEAPLTGESIPVGKETAAIARADAQVADRRNMVYAGTSATHGRGAAVVTATGMQTEFGAIAGLLASVEVGETPLQKNLDALGKSLAKAAIVIVTFIGIIGVWRGQDFLSVIIFAIALAVAIVPEALPAVVTISLAIGVQRMVKRHALIRRLPAVETLGSTTVICTDKTGTLTKNEMTVRMLYTGGQIVEVTGSGYAPRGTFAVGGATIEPPPEVMELLEAGVLCNDARLVKTDETWTVRGDPTEGAFIVVAAKAGIKRDALEKTHPRVGEIPFTSETKRMTTVHEKEGRTVACSKGAPEIIVSSCSALRTKGGSAPMTQEPCDAIMRQAEAMADASLRVLGIAVKHDTDLGEAEKDMMFLGLVGMIDPPRPEAKEAVSKCKTAGTRVIMITGDHPTTAATIARELGILTDGETMTGQELEKIDDATLDVRVEKIQVYARVSPAHKLRIVDALQKKGEIVAMTGDGVNDAPALKKADIGVAMGITGTDVTKEAAAMTLTDDNFASIVAAVEEGRGMFGNIRKYLMYLLSSNIGEALLMASATLFGLPPPLSAVQILYVNLVTDGLPAIALAVDPHAKDLMCRPPRNAAYGIFGKKGVALMLIGAVWSAVINLGLFVWALSTGHSSSEAMTMTFTTLIFVEFFKAYCFRSDRRTILRRPFENRWLNLSIVTGIAMLLVIMYVPGLEKAFGTFAMTRSDWLVVLGLAATILPVLEAGKWLLHGRKQWVSPIGCAT